MRKIDLLSKIIYILIFTVFAMFVFILNIGIQDISFYDNSSDIHNFFVEILLSFKVFDVSFLILGMLIFYTFYNIYFDGIKITKKSYVNMVIAVILTFITIIGESYKVDNTLNLIFSTSAQIVKCMAISIGYYLLYYAGLKKFSTIKLNVISKKKNR